MAQNITEESMTMREEMISRIKACGQCLIENAESIVGTEKYITNLYVTCNFFDKSEVPCVSVMKDIVPDNYIENR